VTRTRSKGTFKKYPPVPSSVYVSAFSFFRHKLSVMEGSSGLQGCVSFFNDQAIFLTGAKGGLGGCFLFKLPSQLPTKKVYIFCRSESKARKTWTKTIPDHIDSILNSGRVKLVVRGILKPNFAIAPDLLAEIAAQTTIVIHSVRILYCLILDF
jgi:hypothetical protein